MTIKCLILLLLTQSWSLCSLSVTKNVFPVLLYKWLRHKYFLLPWIHQSLSPCCLLQTRLKLIHLLSFLFNFFFSIFKFRAIQLYRVFFECYLKFQGVFQLKLAFPQFKGSKECEFKPIQAAQNVITVLYCSPISINIFEVTLSVVTKLCLTPKHLLCRCFFHLKDLHEDTALEMFGIFQMPFCFELCT